MNESVFIHYSPVSWCFRTSGKKAYLVFIISNPILLLPMNQKKARHPWSHSLLVLMLTLLTQTNQMRLGQVLAVSHRKPHYWSGSSGTLVKWSKMKLWSFWSEASFKEPKVGKNVVGKKIEKSNFWKNVCTAFVHFVVAFFFKMKTRFNFYCHTQAKGTFLNKIICKFYTNLSVTFSTCLIARSLDIKYLWARLFKKNR